MTLSCARRRWNLLQAATCALILGGLAASAGTMALAQQPAGKAAQSWVEYQRFAPQRAFAMSADGDAWNWRAATGGDDPGAAADQALGRCNAQGKGPCSLFSVNNIILSGRDWRSATPTALPAIGPLRPQPFWQNSGPQAAAGLFIWSHGYKQGKDSTRTSPQAWVGQFLAAGYDLYRFDRQWIRDWPGDATKLAEAVRQAKVLGYRRVILGGQSAGAWVSLAAAVRGAPVDGVISVAAGHHGEVKDMRDVSVARSEWQQLMTGLRPGPRVVLVQFRDDSYDVGGRIEDARGAFANSGVQAVLIDRPPGFAGHYAGSDFGFARTYGACLKVFMDAGMRQSPCQ